MEPSQKEPVYTPGNNNDIDLGFILYKTGHAIKEFIYFLGYCLRNLLKVIILFLMLLRRNVIWLGIGCVIGLGYGLYMNNGNSHYHYSSESTVRMNFGSVPSIYNTVNYLNALINQQDTKTLSRLFNLTPTEASTILNFEVSPVMSDMATADLYNDQFLQHRRSDLIRTDTFWVKAIPYADFKPGLTKFDYPVQHLKVVSTEPGIFSKLQLGILSLVSHEEALLQNKTILRNASSEEENILERSLKGLDTLSDTYNKRLLQPDTHKDGAQNNLIIPDRGAIRIPELELYERVLTIKDELSALREKSVLQQEIIQVITPFNATGEKKNVYVPDILKDIFYGWALATIIVLLVLVYKYLGKLNPESFMKD